MKNQNKKSSTNQSMPNAEDKLAVTRAIAHRYRGALAQLTNPEIASTLDAQKNAAVKK
jgi:hypothetical protein